MSAKNRYDQAACDLKWAIRAVASARDAFLTHAYIERLSGLENSIIDLRNEILRIGKRAAPGAPEEQKK